MRPLPIACWRKRGAAVWRDPLFLLDLGLDIVYNVRGLHVHGDGLACERLDKDLRAAPQAREQMKGGLLLDVDVRQGAASLQLRASEKEALLLEGCPLCPDLGPDIVYGVRGLHIHDEGLACERLEKICMPPLKRKTKGRVDFIQMLMSDAVRPSSNCLPAKMRRYCLE